MARFTLHSINWDVCVLTTTCGKDILLGLNCVGGETTTAMAGLLGSDAHLVTYGAMAKRPVAIPASFHIFKNLTSHGFWLSRWYKDNDQRRIKLVEELAQIMASGKVSSGPPPNERILCLTFDQFKEPKHEIVTIEKESSDEQASSVISEVFRRIALGSVKKKVILKVEGDDKFKHFPHKR